MLKLQFRCTLLTDVILNQQSATEGPRHTLDFIPGNNFLGIVASKRYGSTDAMTLFHSGKVRFGDAHLASGNMRGLKVPAALFYPKLEGMGAAVYVNHRISDPNSEAMKSLQLKQCRNGFYCFDRNRLEATLLQAPVNFAIKSAYDKQTRTSKDAMLYGYESLDRGSEFLFEVTFDDDAAHLRDVVTEALEGINRIGRSRSAQYGLVRIEPTRCDSAPASARLEAGEVAVYADGRLIFLDAYGLPSLRPSAADLGLPGGSVVWSKSQVRTFSYAPWNFKRQAYDTERCGIEKGSVFVVKLPSAVEVTTDFVGFYQNEGFGKVIYNPDFLASDAEGRSTYRFVEPKPETPTLVVSTEEKLCAADANLLALLRDRKREAEETAAIFAQVNRFARDNRKSYGRQTASQWGSIRGIAMASATGALRQDVEEYINHGVAANEWREKKRSKLLFEFMDRYKDDEALLRRALINLAAEMAKKVIKEN